MGIGRGQGELSPLDFETLNFPIKVLVENFFFNFEWVKWNFATIPPLEKSTVVPWKKW